MFLNELESLIKEYSESALLLLHDIDARPAVDDNGTPADTTDDTIYAASEDGFLYAINPDGTSKGLSWPFSVGYVTSRATIGADGTIYVGSRDSKVYAIKPDGTSKGLSWPFTAPSGNIMTSPGPLILPAQ